jgi:hypothetical protein
MPDFDYEGAFDGDGPIAEAVTEGLKAVGEFFIELVTD